ncbi:MAG: hypothetical protein AAF957_24265 [Planctomycetota bacterium]
MSRAYEAERHDLFDFPEVEGLEEFGLVPPVLEPFEEEAAKATAERRQAEAEAALAAQAAEQSASPATAEARPNPPVPEGVTDLDEDLFGFDEIFSLEDDPYFNGTLTLDGAPANPIFLDEDALLDEVPPPFAEPVADEPAPAPVAEAAAGNADEPYHPAPRPVPREADPEQVLPEPALTEDRAPAAAPATPAAAPVQESTPTANAAEAPPAPRRVAADAALPESLSEVAPIDEPAAEAAAPAASRRSAQRAAAAQQPVGAGATLDRGPRILLPEDVPYSNRVEAQRYVWALVACFLLINTGIFFLAHQASSNFQTSITQATGLLAEAIARQNANDTRASAPVVIAPAVEHTVVETPEEEQFQPDAWIDPTDYRSPHEFAVGNAKALLAEGRFEDARRLLNHVLANQSRVPLAPSLREEIDYLIPLTYYEQGRATAPEVQR